MMCLPEDKWIVGVALLGLLALVPAGAQSLPPGPATPPQPPDQMNRRLEQLRQMLPATGGDYRIGAEDLLEITVFEAAELNRAARVSAGGEIALPLLGGVMRTDD